MRAATGKIYLASGVLAAVTLITLYFVNALRLAPTPALDHVEAKAPGGDHRPQAEGAQWFDALPGNSAMKPEGPRAYGDVIAELISSRKPDDALTAFGMIEGCDLSRPVFELDPTPAAFLPRKKQCATITAAQHRSKYDYLRVAAFAGTPGAGSFWLAYGPSGDRDALRTRPNDPAVVAWKQEATALVIRDANNGDFNALQDLMNGYAGRTPYFDPDPSRALAYAIAFKDVAHLMKLEYGLQNLPVDADIEALSAKLSPEQIAWAKKVANGIVATSAKRQAAVHG